MKTTPDTILYISRLKSSLLAWRTVAIVVAFAAIIGLISNANKSTNILSHSMKDHIARIFIDGQIEQDFSMEQHLADLADNKSVKAVVVHINSGGGTVYGGESLYKSLRKIAAKKPVAAVLGSTATSAAYMAAIATDHIVAGQSTLTGSIGAVFVSPEFSELAKKVGINFVIIKSGKLKAEPLPFHKASQEVLEHINNLVMDDYYMFVDLVSERRKLTKDYVLKLADGGVMTGTTAFKKKLVDAIGSEQEALDWLYQVRKINKKLKVRDADFYQAQDNLYSIFKDVVPKSIAGAINELVRSNINSGARVAQ